MPSPATIPATLNKTTGVTAYDPSNPNARIVITSLLRGGTVTIDNQQYDFDGPIEFYSPIRCKSFFSASLGNVAYFSEGPTYPYALRAQYKGLGVTSASYEFGNVGGTINPESTEAQMIADYATAGIGITRMGAIEDLLDGNYFDEDLVSNLWGPSCTEPCGNLNGCMIKCLTPANLSYTSGPYPEYYVKSGSRQRNYYLRNDSGTDLNYNGVEPGSTLSAPYNPLQIFYWNASGKTLVKLS